MFELWYGRKVFSGPGLREKKRQATMEKTVGAGSREEPIKST